MTLDIDAGGVARLQLNRPEVLNAFDEAMIGELAESVAALGADARVRCIVLAAAGRAFCAGADIAWMRRQAANSPERNLADARRFAAMLRGLHECPKPTIARVHGHAFGGGVGLIAACDIVVAAPQCRFAVSEARFGILPSVIGPYLVHAVGARQARRLALTAAQFGADEALRLGLVHEVAAPEALDAQVERLVGELCSNGPLALGEIKRLFAQLHGRPIDDAAGELTAQTIARVRATAEAREGFAAFVEKRPAAWVRQEGPE